MRSARRSLWASASPLGSGSEVVRLEVMPHYPCTAGTMPRRRNRMDNARPVALVTGSARRIGAAIARTLHAAGYDLALHCRGSRADADALAAALDAARPGSTFVQQADL